MGFPRSTLPAPTGPTFSFWHKDLTPAAISVADTPECPANDPCRILEEFKLTTECIKGLMHPLRGVARIANSVDC